MILVHELTEEGKDYLKNGLPEKQLLDFIGNEKSLEEVSKFPKAQIAIGWAKKNGWIIIENSVVRLTEDGRKASKEKSYVEMSLEKVNREDNVEPETIKVLFSRNLIREVKVPTDNIKRERKTSIWQKILNIFSKKKVETKDG